MSKSHPILFSAPMVRALLDGSKTQTRRIVKPQPIADSRFSGGHCIAPTKRTEGATLSVEAPYVGLGCPYGRSGDRLWVRESWAPHPQSPQTIFYRATIEAEKGFPVWEGPWKPSIHMPRWASRITLEITRVRVEQLQDISRGDAMAEGCPFPNMAGDQDPRAWYDELWNTINGPGSFDANPWVWVIEFKRLKGSTP